MEQKQEGTFEIVSINISEKTGVRKKPVPRVHFIKDQGIDGDAHKGVLENRQVSLLAMEDIEEARTKAQERMGPDNPLCQLKPGDFAENLTTRGLVLHELPLGTKLKIGTALLEVSQIGKECHHGCEIRKLTGDCAMPRRGIFARVLREGEAGSEDRAYYRI